MRYKLDSIKYNFMNFYICIPWDTPTQIKK